MASRLQSLNVIGLISGGKDSFFSLLHCLVNSHHIVALANLYPQTASSLSSEAEELNSYMYQVAGHGLIPLYADVLGLPLYRGTITGGAVNSSKDYYVGKDSSDIGDETESLFTLLKEVMVAHPNANAVCSGAILSTYQRTRIESVAGRLNLIPLSYLWQYPSLPPPSPGGLLDDMAAVGFDIRIVKVASGGLDENLLWCNLMSPTVRKRIEKSVARFGGSVLGEGGEYETLVVDGPVGIWKGSIDVQDRERYVGKGGGGEAWVGLTEGAGNVKMKIGEGALSNGRWQKCMRPIELWDKEFETLVNKLMRLQDQNITKVKWKPLSSMRHSWEPKVVVIKDGAVLKLSNLTASGNGTNASEQMLGINMKLLNILAEYSHCDANDIVFTTILLRSMADFGAANSVYGRLFTMPNPPARVTVACGDALPEGVKLMVSCVVDLNFRSAREGLHVQSRSYWAPANIGPYSQAISVPWSEGKGISMVHVAGQIPLVPASMMLLQTEEESREDISLFVKRACLGLQHLWRIGRAMNVGWWTGGLAFITGPGDVQTKARIAWEAWREVHQHELWEKDDEEEDGLDVWYRRYGGMGSLVKNTAEFQALPDFARFSDSTLPDVPGFMAVEMDELPRGCEIEWQSLGVAYRNASTRGTGSLVSYTGFQSDEELRLRMADTFSEVDSPQMVQATVYTPNPSLVSRANVQVVPCRAVWGAEGRPLAGFIALYPEAAQPPLA